MPVASGARAPPNQMCWRAPLRPPHPAAARALAYMGLTAGTPLRELDVDSSRNVGTAYSSTVYFLGVPILLRGRAFGNLYLTEKQEGSFTQADQELVETSTVSFVHKVLGAWARH